MSTSMELEIKHLFDAEASPEEIAARLKNEVENGEQPFAPDNVISYCRFLLNAGLYTELIQLVYENLDRPSFRIPWPYFLQALSLSRNGIDADFAATLLKGIEDSKGMAEACRSKALDFYAPQFRIERADRRLRAIKSYQQSRERLLDELLTLRTQQLFEQEQQLLRKLMRMYPNDPEIAKESVGHKERQALDVLSNRRTPARPLEFEEPVDPRQLQLAENLLECLKRAADEDPWMAADLAIAAAMMDLWDGALELLQKAPASEDLSWLHLELLLGARHYLELLHAVGVVEHEKALDSETFFATAYLRSQALWGLGQKHAAIEVLESLLASRPNYRSGESLLGQWRSA